MDGNSLSNPVAFFYFADEQGCAVVAAICLAGQKKPRLFQVSTVTRCQGWTDSGLNRWFVNASNKRRLAFLRSFFAGCCPRLAACWENRNKQQEGTIQTAILFCQANASACMSENKRKQKPLECQARATWAQEAIQGPLARAVAKQTGDAGQAGGPPVAALSECLRIFTLAFTAIFRLEKNEVNYVTKISFVVVVVFFKHCCVYSNPLCWSIQIWTCHTSLKWHGSLKLCPQRRDVVTSSPYDTLRASGNTVAVMDKSANRYQPTQLPWEH